MCGMTDRLSRAARLPGWLRDAILPILGPRSYRETYGPLRGPVISTQTLTSILAWVCPRACGCLGRRETARMTRNGAIRMALTIRMWIRDHREWSDRRAAHRLSMPDTTSVGPATLPGRPLGTRRSLSVWPCTAPAVGLSRPRPAARTIPGNDTS